MKQFKTGLAFVIVLSLLLALSAAAFADDAQYPFTRDFVGEIAEIPGFTCTVSKILSDATGNYEAVRIDYAGGELSDYQSSVVALIAEDGSKIQLCLYNLIHFDPARLDELLSIVNQINADTSGVKLYVDESDCSVTAEMYQLLTGESGLELAERALGFMISFTDDAYEALSNYAI